MPDIRLAPLAGVTDWPFRTLCFREGCAAACTEMVSAMGYVYAPNQLATQSLLEKGPEEGRLVLQLFGKEPEYMARAAAILSRDDRFCGIDINMGCPAPKIANSGEGSGLMRTPELARDVMRAVVENSQLPVSVKMRLGWDSEHINVLQLAHLAEEAGIKEITVHGRTREQQYSGTADWSWIPRIKQETGLRVIGNGDLFTPEDILRRLEESGADGVMIGRGAMGNPWLFSRTLALLEGKRVPEPDAGERINMILTHYALLEGWKPRHIAVREMRKHIAWYLHGLRGATKLRVQINTMQDPEQVKDLLRRFGEEADRA